MNQLRNVLVTRYLQPLREGGSLPALAEAEDGFLYVIKFRGSGQGVKTLIAELLGGEIARLLGLQVPELVFAELDGDFGRTEADEEIQDLLKNSQGLNLGLHFLSGAFTYDPVANQLDPLLASLVVWLDAFLANVDRTYRNPNLLYWNKALWLIDHGASLFFHHNWETFAQKAAAPFPYINQHILLTQASQLAAANELARASIHPDQLELLVQQLPDTWLEWGANYPPPAQLRATYFQFLRQRLQHADQFTKEASDAAKALV